MALKVGIRLFAMAFVCAGFLALGGCKDESADELVAAAKLSLKAEATASAIIQLKSALQANPSNSEARYLFGEALLLTNNPAAALIELTKADELGYREDDVVPALARAMLQVGQVSQLVEKFANRKLTTPTSIAGLKSSLALAYWQQQNLKAAATEVDEALLAMPEYGPALLLRANMKAGGGDVDGALALVENILQRNPKDFQARYYAGVLRLHGKDDIPGALKEFVNAVEIQPKFAQAHQAIFMLRLQSKDIVGAGHQIDAMKIVLPKHPTTQYLLAIQSFLNSDYKTARESIQALMRLAPESGQLQFLAGLIEYQDGSLLRAQTFLSKGLQGNPEFLSVRKLLAKTYLRDGHPEKALAVLAPALAQKQVDSETLAIAGEIHLHLGNTAQSEAFYTAASKLAPDDFRNRTAMALIRLSKGEAASAFTELEAVAKSTEDPYVDFALLSARLRQGDLPGALRAVEQLEKKQPGKPYPPTIKGRILEKQLDVVGARASYERALTLDAGYFPAAVRLSTFDIADGKLDKALHRFDAVLKADPAHLRALLAVANIRHRAGAKTSEVVELLNNAIRLNPSELQPRLRLIELHLQADNFRAALEAGLAADAALPSNPRILSALGGVQLRSGEFEPALSSFSKVAALEPTTPLAQFRLAEVYLAANDRVGAKKALLKSLQIMPDYVPSQRSLIAVYLIDANPDEALKVAKTVQSQRPKGDIGFLLEGDIESSRKRLESAIRAYRASLSRASTAEAAGKLHTVLLMAGRTEEADKLLETWLVQQPTDVQFLMYLGDRALVVQQWAVAEKRFREVIRRKPDHSVAYNNLAVSLLHQQNPAAIPMAERANELSPGKPSLMETLALALAGDGKFDRALSTQKQVVALAPSRTGFGLNLAKIYLQAGDKGNARRVLQGLVQTKASFLERDEAVKILATL